MSRNKNRKTRNIKIATAPHASVGSKKKLKFTPQIKGITTAIMTLTPKKPNSALRKVARVKLSNNKIVTAYIPGEAHSLTIHNMVLLIPKKTQDLPGVKFKVLRGLLDSKPPIRNTSRSKYGVKKNPTGKS